VPLFKTSFKAAWREAQRAHHAEFQHVVAPPPAADLAAELMQAFAVEGPKRGKPLTEHELVGWKLGSYEFSSRGQRAMCYKKLRAPIREALQVLEHAELVYQTIRTDKPDNWTATSRGLETLKSGNDVVI
jgi:hypothetical protein